MKHYFEFEVITNSSAYSFHPEKKLDHRKVKKDFIKILKCDDVSMLVYTKVT